MGKELTRLVRASEWRIAAPTLTNGVCTHAHSSTPGDLPPWELGLSLPLPEPGSEPPEWFRDVEQIANVAAKVAARTKCRFVIGVAERTTGTWEDLFDVDTGTPDIVALAAAVSRVLSIPRDQRDAPLVHVREERTTDADDIRESNCRALGNSPRVRRASPARS